MIHPEIKYCEKTIYNYIDQEALEQSGIKNIDLGFKASRKQIMKNHYYKPRKDKNIWKDVHIKILKDIWLHIRCFPCRDGYCLYRWLWWSFYPNIPIRRILFHERHSPWFPNITKHMWWLVSDLTEKDRKEFSEVMWFRMCLCGKQWESLAATSSIVNPMASDLKPHVKNNHDLFRYVCLNYTELKKIRVHSQKDVDRILLHMNFLHVLLSWCV